MDAPLNRLDWFARAAIVLAGLLGAGGIAAAAAASHVGDSEILAPLALIALTQAPAVLALALYGRRWPFRLATVFIGVGALLFSAELAIHHLTGDLVLPMAAPIGGSAMIVGWLLLVLAAFVSR